MNGLRDRMETTKKKKVVQKPSASKIETEKRELYNIVFNFKNSILMGFV